jgi:hypothetical protein
MGGRRMIFTRPLDQFDFSAIHFTFPDLNHSMHQPLDSRLYVYRDDRRWAVVIETVSYYHSTPNVVNSLHPYGDCLPDLGAEGYLDEPGFGHQIWFNRLDNMDYDGSVFLDTSASQRWRYRGDVPFVVRGHSLPGLPAAGEDFITVLRRVVPAHRELFLSDEAERRSRIPFSLPQIMRLDEWNHPDLARERPSDNETFRLIADVITTGDTSRYRPTQPPTTHWSHWPEAGSGA